VRILKNNSQKACYMMALYVYHPKWIFKVRWQTSMGRHLLLSPRRTNIALSLGLTSARMAFPQNLLLRPPLRLPRTANPPIPL